MRKVATLVVFVVALLTLPVALATGSAGAAGHTKLVEGTLYDTTCVTACVPECPPPPHCGPITAQSRADIVCPQAQKRIIACPLETSTATAFPVYSTEGAVVHVRERGSATVLATLTVVEGHFEIRLAPGEYVFHSYLPEEPCWSGEVVRVKVTARAKGPIPASIDVSNGCVVHPDSP